MRFRILTLVLLLLFAAVPRAVAQRIQLPTQVPQTDALNPRWSAPYPTNQFSSGAPNGYSGGTTVYQPGPPATGFDPYSTAQPSLPSAVNGSPAFGGPANGVTRTPPPFVTGQSPYSPPSYGAPANPYGAAPYGAQPSVAAPASPYYTPGPGSPQYLFPDGVPSAFPNGMPQYQYSNEWTRLLQRVRLSDAWLFGGSDVNDLGVNEVETSATFDIPLFGLQDHFLITPGFGLHLWQGPVHTGPGAPDLPGQTYDAYLDTGWNPKLNNWFSAELGVRVGVYTDFDTFSTNSFRVRGRGLGVVNLSPTLQFKAGVIYINRNDLKLLPAFGLIWDPSEDRHWEIFFPRPKIAWRLSTLGNFNLWMYVAGEYGGGAWTIIRDDGFHDSFDYNDFRAQLGFEWIPEDKNGLSGFIEAGYVFKRELIYVSLNPDQFDLPDTFMIRGGVSF